VDVVWHCATVLDRVLHQSPRRLARRGMYA